MGALCIFQCILLLILMVPGSNGNERAHSILASLHIQSNCIQNKTVFSNTSRVMFLAALEGSGHHGFKEVMSECKSMKYEPTGGTVCEWDRTLSMLVLTSNAVNQTRFATGLFAPDDNSHNYANLLKVHDQMRNISQKTEPHLVYIGLDYGMMSYPTGYQIRGGKTINRPDMAVLATLAEHAQLDIRYLVLLRNAGAVLNSTMDTRSFGREQPQILIANAEAMFSQLMLLSADFYRCLTYEDLVHTGLSNDQRQNLVDFLHPTLLNAERLDRMLLKIRVKREEEESQHERTSFRRKRRLLVSDWNTEEGRLNRKYQEILLQTRLNMIHKLCTSQQAWL